MFYISKILSNGFQQGLSQKAECSTLGEFVVGDVKVLLGQD